MPVTVPDILPNGAKVIAFKGFMKESPAPAGCRVLCEWHNGPSDRTLFVTWALDEACNAYWGHYFETFDEAFNDFKER